VKSKTFQSAAFSQQKCCISINSVQIRYGSYIFKRFTAGSNPNLTKFATVRIQSKSSPVLISVAHAFNATIMLKYFRESETEVESVPLENVYSYDDVRKIEHLNL